MYKLESHAHTKEVSCCSVLPARVLIESYKKVGYSSVCITDHYRRDVFDYCLKGNTTEEKVHQFFEGYRQAKAAGDEMGVHVICGMELTFVGFPFDHLVYGLTEEILQEHPFIFDLKREDFTPLAKKYDLFFAQAHPFRPNVIVAGPDVIEGMEVFNGNPRHHSDNLSAYRYALKNGLVMLSGSDTHEPEDIGIAGMLFNHPIENARDFIDTLRTRDYSHMKLLTE